MQAEGEAAEEQVDKQKRSRQSAAVDVSADGGCKRGREKGDVVPERWRWQVSYAKLPVIMSTSCSTLAFEQHRTMGWTDA